MKKIDLIQYSDVLKLLCPSISHLEVTQFQTQGEREIQYAVIIDNEEKTYQLNLDDMLCRLNDLMVSKRKLFKFFSNVLPDSHSIKQKGFKYYVAELYALEYLDKAHQILPVYDDLKKAVYCRPNKVDTITWNKPTIFEKLLEFYIKD